MQERIGYIYNDGTGVKCVRADDSAVYQVCVCVRAYLPECVRA